MFVMNILHDSLDFYSLFSKLLMKRHKTVWFHNTFRRQSFSALCLLTQQEIFNANAL